MLSIIGKSIKACKLSLILHLENIVKLLLVTIFTVIFNVLLRFQAPDAPYS